MLRFLTIFLSIAILGNAGAATFGLYTYEINPDNVSVTITDYPIGAIGAIEIPATIEERSVTSIGDNAFFGCSSLTSITIPGSATSIGNFAFQSCTGLTSIIIPDSVTSIGDRAFYSCSGLTRITIGNSVTSIGDFAFYQCSSLTSVTIPDSVTSIGGYAFYYCKGLTAVIIGNSVTSIGDFAFAECSSLTSMTIGNSVTSIGDYAFYYCTNLASIRFESTVAPTIGFLAFDGISSAAIIQYPLGATGYAASYDGVPTVELLSINPISKSTVSAGESYDIAVTSNTDWTVTESLDWATVSLASGSGDSTVTVTVDANTAMGARSGTITIGGELHTLVQDGTDTDSDGLLDSYEQTIIDADLGDAIYSLDDVLPGDDFDGDGCTNLEEQNDGTDPIDADSYLTPPQEARWEPAGWVYYAWPYAYDVTQGRWHFFNQSDKQWRVNLTNSQWATLDAATGWNYYAWPYSYSSDQGAWHWYNANTQWVFDLASGEWELFGRAPILAPYTLAPYTLEPGTVAESADTITFIGNNNDYIEFEKYEDDGFSVGTYSYSHIDEMSAAFDDKGGSYVDVYDGGGRYPAESYTLNFTSETALTRSSDGKAYELYPSSDLAPTSFEGLTAAIDIYGYSNVQGGFEGFARVAFSTASSGIFYGNLTLPFNYTYLKVGPREGSLNATANNTINGSVDVSYIFHFLTVSSGYFVGEERFSNGVVESRWGTFSLD